VVAVGVGLLVRYLRLGEQIEAKRRQATLRLRAGNLTDFMSAAQSYADILARRSGDRDARQSYARIQAAIPVEFGDPNPQTPGAGEEGDDLSAERVGAAVYTHIAGGSLERASALLARARRHSGAGPLLNYLEGRVRLLEGNAVAAEELLRPAHKLDNKDVMIQRALGDSLAAQGRADAAVDIYRRTLAQNPDHVASLLSKARVQVTARVLVAEAEKDLTSIVQGRRRHLASRGQRGWAYLILAQLAIGRGQVKEGRSYIDQAKSNTPIHDAPFQDEMAGALIDSFQLGEAEKVVQLSKKMMRGRPQPFFRMAQIHLRYGQPRAALAELDQATKDQTVSSSNLLLAQIKLELGQLREAEAEVDRVLVLAPDLIEAHVVKAKVLAANNLVAAAEQRLRGQLQKNPHNARLLTALGEIYLTTNRTREAREKFDEALKADSLAFDALLKLAQVFEAEGNYGEARKRLHTASQANYGNILALKELARLESDMGDLGEAATNYRELVKRAANDPVSHLALAKVLTLQRQFAEAEKEIRQAETLGADAMAIALAKGRLSFRRERYSEAAPLLSSVTNSPAGRTSAEAWDLLVRVHLENNDDQQARNVARAMAGVFANAPETELAAARIDMTAGQPQLAVQRLRRAQQLLQQQRRPPIVRAEILVLLGRVHHDDRQLQTAEAEYTEAARVCPQCAEPVYRLGLVLDERGRGDEAIKSLKTATELDPSFTEVYFNLGQICDRKVVEEKREDLRLTAIQAYEKYLKLNPPAELRNSAIEALQNLKKK
jgi:tetratricopeptide (TPR) repeat protein